MTVHACPQPASRAELFPGAATPWGGLVDVEPRSPGVFLVKARFGEGLFVEGPVRDALAALVSPHGPAWWGGRAGEAAVGLLVDAEDRVGRRRRLLALHDERPDWLDALAGVCGVPNAAQVRRILWLHERFEIAGLPDLAAFAREGDTGMVHGWIGDRLFVGVEPCGRAHS